jgi:hypothetical protein
MSLSALQEPPTDQGTAKVIPFEKPEADLTEAPLSFDEVMQEVRNLRARNRLLEQLALALGDVNRYYASLALGRSATDNEAFDHFVMNGGKQCFDQTHPAG